MNRLLVAFFLLCSLAFSAECQSGFYVTAEELDELERTLKQLESESKTQKEQLRELEAELTGLKQLRTTLESQLSEAVKPLETLRESLKESERELKAAQGESLVYKWIAGAGIGLGISGLVYASFKR